MLFAVVELVAGLAITAFAHTELLLDGFIEVLAGNDVISRLERDIS